MTGVNKISLLLGALCLSALFAFFNSMGLEALGLFPLVLLFIYLAVFETEKFFLSIAFLTPLSVNIEEYTDGLGLFLPTEPLLFGLMVLFLFIQIKSPFLDVRIWRNPIIICVLSYIIWLVFTSVTSTDPLISFKSVLAKLWFIIPLLIFGTHFFRKHENRIIFLWLFIVSCCLVVCFTLVHHSIYGFGEEEGHWVMWPFFKDHTIYGATVALCLPISLALLKQKGSPPLSKAILILLNVILIVGLIFSYTRAAWLSVICASIIGMLVYFRVNFRFLMGLGLAFSLIIYSQWDNIQLALAKNTHEHTTEAFEEKIQSAANVTTDASNLERINRWDCAIQMFKKEPITGFGPGTYAFEYAPFQDPENQTIISTNFGDMGNAHSEYLGTLSETGLLGLLLFLSIIASIFISAIRLYYKTAIQENDTKLLIMGIIVSLSSYFIHAFLNNYLDTDKAAVPVWAMCAMIIAMSLPIANDQSIKQG
ncbi:O-antigen ligase family protein [Crocinitomicaceae bacterium]|jgi:putative inorganic carbon (HCO3(-)) transporter|nr:O-antigen ligase family protein [Crocinitomicaceae bacterium]